MRGNSDYEISYLIPTLFEVWDGDFDRADDTSDSNSPNIPPFPYSPSILFQGVNPGLPLDDGLPSSPLTIAPSIFYTLTSADGSWMAENSNPSGNQEWEVFRSVLSTDPAAAAADFTAPSFPGGMYALHIIGADGRNTFFFRASYDMYGVGSIGDTVWIDQNGNNLYDAGEQVLPGSLMSLYDEHGTLLRQMSTDANGQYTFDNLPGGTYIVTVDATVSPAFYAGLVPTWDVDGVSTQNTSTVTLLAGQVRTDVDFAYRRVVDSNGATRTLGYWQTHLQGIHFASLYRCLNLGKLQYGSVYQDLTDASEAEAMAIFHGSIPKQGSVKRSSLGKARMQLGQQLVAALANSCFLGTTPAAKGLAPNLLSGAVSAIDGTDVYLINSFVGRLDAFNNSGDVVQLPSSLTLQIGSADPQAAIAAAAKDASGIINPGPAFE